MNAGTENRTKVIAAIALGAVAVIVFVTQMSGWFSGASSSAATPVASRPMEATGDSTPAPRTAAHGRATPGKKEVATFRSMDPSLRFDLLKESEDTKYEGVGRNIFRVFVPPPPHVIQNPVLDQKPAPYVPPPPPPIPLVFYGFATPSSGAKRIFLAKNEDVFIAKEGDIVDRRYKVVRISANAVEILDVLSNNRQSIPLTQG